MLKRTNTLEVQHKNENSEKTNSNEWGILMSLNSKYPHISLTEDVILIGRESKEKKYQINNSKISSTHCKIMNDQQGSIYIIDVSRNGVFVNKKKVPISIPARIQNGDEITFAELSSPTEENSDSITYIFRSNQNQKMNENENEKMNENENQKMNENENQKMNENQNEKMNENQNQKMNENQNSNQRVSRKTNLNTFLENQENDEFSMKRMREAKSNSQEENHLQNTNQKPQSIEKQKSIQMDEVIMENIICPICRDLIYKCVTLIPCMHNFCGACYSQWMLRSNLCPSCRVAVSEIQRNHSINSIVDDFLTKHPEKRRDAKDLKELDELNKIMDDTIKLQQQKKKDEEMKKSTQKTPSFTNSAFSRQSRPFRRRNNVFSSSSTSELSDSSDSESESESSEDYDVCRECRVPRAQDGFQCDPKNPNHYMCSICYNPFPKRPDQNFSIQCENCRKYFCDGYWGCSALAGKGFLKKISDFEMKEIPQTSFNSNPHEKFLFEDYLTKNSIDFTQLYKTMLEKLDKSEYTAIEMPKFHAFRSNSLICKNCFIPFLNELLYGYRVKIDDQFPKRDNCWYGRNCRTQTHKLSHCQRYNHICEQTHRK